MKPINRDKANKRLKELSWTDLDWLEQKCRELKGSARGGQFFSNTGDATHQAQGAAAMRNFFDNAYTKAEMGGWG